MDVTTVFVVLSTSALGVLLYLFFKALAGIEHGHSHGGRSCTGCCDGGAGDGMAVIRPSVEDMAADLGEIGVDISDVTTKAELAERHMKHCSGTTYFKAPKGCEGAVIKVCPHASGEGFQMRVIFSGDDDARNEEIMAKIEEAFGEMAGEDDAGKAQFSI